MSLQLFPGVWIVLSEGHKNYFKGWCFMNSKRTFLVSKLKYYGHIIKVCKPDNSESRNSLKRSFKNIGGLRLNFVECASFLESKFLDLLALRETNLDVSIDSGNFSVRDYLPSIQRDSITHMHGCSL